MDSENKKKHRPRQSGSKAAKKSAKKHGKLSQHNVKVNELFIYVLLLMFKAFISTSWKKSDRLARRSADVYFFFVKIYIF